MLKRMRYVAHWLLIGTLFLSFGGGLAVLQTFAWGKMLVGYSSTSSLQEAVKKTFDGEHPCSLCKVVKENKKKEEKKPLLKAESKKEAPLTAAIRLKNPLGVTAVYFLPGYFGHDAEVIIGVPLQPPRSV
jgi:hypothetical protein